MRTLVGATLGAFMLAAESTPPRTPPACPPGTPPGTLPTAPETAGAGGSSSTTCLILLGIFVGWRNWPSTMSDCTFSTCTICAGGGGGGGGGGGATNEVKRVLVGNASV